MRIVILAGLAALVAACGAETDEPACCAIEPKHACRSDLAQAGATPGEIDIILGPDAVVCPSAALSESRMAELEPAWAGSEACRTLGDAARLRATGMGLCRIKGMADLDHYVPPAGVSAKAAADCAAGLVARGVKENELWLVLHEPAGVCPNNGVSEERLREIIANDWAPAGCRQFTSAEMLKAMESGACGGDAG